MPLITLFFIYFVKKMLESLDQLILYTFHFFFLLLLLYNDLLLCLFQADILWIKLSFLRFYLRQWGMYSIQFILFQIAFAGEIHTFCQFSDKKIVFQRQHMLSACRTSLTACQQRDFGWIWHIMESNFRKGTLGMIDWPEFFSCGQLLLT